MICDANNIDNSASIGFEVTGPVSMPREAVVWAERFHIHCRSKNSGGEAYLSAFEFGDEMSTLLEEAGSVRGYSGPCSSDWLWWDIDVPDDLAAAQQAARQLMIYLSDACGFNEDEVMCFFSGAKGFHILVSLRGVHDGPSAAFHTIVRRVAEEVASRAGVDVDGSVYDRVRPFRAPNSKHQKTGLFKRLITWEELRDLSPDGIRDLAREPKPFDPEEFHPAQPNEGIRRLWRECAPVPTEDCTTPESGVGRVLTKTTVRVLSGNFHEGERAECIFIAAADLSEKGVPIGLIKNQLQMEGVKSGLPIHEVHRQIQSGINQGRRCCQPNSVNADVGDTMIDDWLARQDDPTQARLFCGGRGELEHFEFGPGLLTVIGGEPGSGKTALVTQVAVDAIRMNPDLRVLVCNVEMRSFDLLSRQVARISGVPLDSIYGRSMSSEERRRYDNAVDQMKGIGDRLCIMERPRCFRDVQERVASHRADIVVVDFLQQMPFSGYGFADRGKASALMSEIRSMCSDGMAVLVVSAMSRGLTNAGKAIYARNMSGFRDSSDIEYSADAAYIMPTAKQMQSGKAKIECVKARHTRPRDLDILFEGEFQRFVDDNPASNGGQGND